MPLCAEAEARFQTFVSVPPVTMWTYDDRWGGSTTEDLFDTDIMRDHIEFIKETHKKFVDNDPADDDLKSYRRFYKKRHFYHVITREAYYNLIEREHQLDDEDDDPASRTAHRQSKVALRTWFLEVERLHDEVVECRRPGITNQLMGEQLYRQSALTLPPNVAQTISEFSGAKDPKRVFLDAVKNRGVALPRPVESETEEALRLELAKPEPNQSKIAALRRELARKGGRRTRRTKRRGTFRARRR